MTWLGPDEEWPTHSRPDAQRALQEVREAGWSLRPAGHTFGKVSCPYEGHSQCEFTVFSTPKGDQSGSETAIRLRRKLRKCEALLVEENEQRTAASVAEALNEVADLVGIAETLRQSEVLHDERDRVASDAEDEPDPIVADDLLDDAIEIEALADELELKAWTGAATFELGAPWPPSEGAIQLARAAREKIIEVIEDQTLDETTEAVAQSLLDRLAVIDPIDPHD